MGLFVDPEPDADAGPSRDGGAVPETQEQPRLDAAPAPKAPSAKPVKKRAPKKSAPQSDGGSGSRAKNAAKRAAVTLLRLLVLTAPLWALAVAPRVHALVTGEDTQPVLTFLTGHLGLVMVPLTPLVMGLVYTSRNVRRVRPVRRKGKPTKPIQPALPSITKRWWDISAIIGYLDAIWWRAIYVLAFTAGVVFAVRVPVSVDTFLAVREDPAVLADIAAAFLPAPLAAAAISARLSSIIRRRTDRVSEIYAVARDTLHYPKKPNTVHGFANLNPAERRLVVPWQAVDVTEWRSLYEVETFFVRAPEALSVAEVKEWDEFDTNLNAKVPRTEQWRVQRDRRGRGATVGPANYPTAVLWDGHIDPDPLTFFVGANLETGDMDLLTLGEASPHAAISGGTSSGKTSFAETLAAQVLIKPMPWDENLWGQVVIIDPKGPFARRWRGRPGVVVADGQQDAAEPDDDGNPITGPQVMAACMEWLEEEHQRRASVLAQYPDLATWVHLPDEVKRAERFAPLLVIMDEYIDHTEMESGKDDRVIAENAAREVVTRLTSWQARKVRNVGMHYAVIAQRVNMSLIGSVLMTNLPVRVMTGQMDKTQTQTLFMTDEVPKIPSDRIVIENGEPRSKTIPGRARIMNAGGQPIRKIQVFWFGGKANLDTLDKWLPRSPAAPNGDFSFPPGRPRRPSDFDEEGQPLSPTPPMLHATDEDLPMDGIEKSADDFSTSTVPEHVRDAEQVEQAEGDTTDPADLLTAREGEVDPWEAIEAEQDAQDATIDSDAIFPAAPAAPAPAGATASEAVPAGAATGEIEQPADVEEAPPCSQDGCSGAAPAECAVCSVAVCDQHAATHPDPAEGTQVCPGCAAAHPLTVTGLADAYAALHAAALTAGLVPSWRVQEDGSAMAWAHTPSGGKIVQVHADGEQITARSRSGQVHGREASAERVVDAITSWHRKQQQEQS